MTIIDKIDDLLNSSLVNLVATNDSADLAATHDSVGLATTEPIFWRLSRLRKIFSACNTSLTFYIIIL